MVRLVIAAAPSGTYCKEAYKAGHCADYDEYLQSNHATIEGLEGHIQVIRYGTATVCRIYLAPNCIIRLYTCIAAIICRYFVHAYVPGISISAVTTSYDHI